MTRKDYVLIAAAFVETQQATDWSESYGHHELRGVTLAANFLADNLAVENPRFDRARFLKACGVTHLCRVKEPPQPEPARSPA